MAKREVEPFSETSGNAGTTARADEEANQTRHRHDGAPEMTVTAEPPAGLRRKRPIGRYVLFLLLAGAAVWGGRTGYTWWTDGRFLVETDDAYVAADITTLSAKATGFITEVLVSDNEPVKVGDVIARIDDGDYRIALSQAEAALAANAATVDRIARQTDTARAQVDEAQAAVASAAAKLAQTEAAFARQTALVSSSVSSQSQLDDARANRDAARAALQSANAAVEVARTNIDVLIAQRIESERTGETLATAVAKAKRDLTFTEIRSPVTGVLGNIAFRLGTFVTPGQQLGSLVALDTAHIDANYKETQVADLRPGEKVRISVDALDASDVIEGTVESLSPATGSVFSLLPANNATGNFTKVVQRLPVRIAIPRDVADSGRLRPGMSVVVAADSRTAQPVMIGEAKTAKAPQG